MKPLGITVSICLVAYFTANLALWTTLGVDRGWDTLDRVLFVNMAVCWLLSVLLYRELRRRR